MPGRRSTPGRSPLAERSKGCILRTTWRRTYILSPVIRDNCPYHIVPRKQLGKVVIRIVLSTAAVNDRCNRFYIHHREKLWKLSHGSETY